MLTSPNQKFHIKTSANRLNLKNAKCTGLYHDQDANNCQSLHQRPQTSPRAIPVPPINHRHVTARRCHASDRGTHLVSSQSHQSTPPPNATHLPHFTASRFNTYFRRSILPSHHHQHLNHAQHHIKHPPTSPITAQYRPPSTTPSSTSHSPSPSPIQPLPLPLPLQLQLQLQLQPPSPKCQPPVRSAPSSQPSSSSSSPC